MNLYAEGYAIIVIGIVAVIALGAGIYNFQTDDTIPGHFHADLSVEQRLEVKTMIKNKFDNLVDEDGRLWHQVANVNQTAIQTQATVQDLVGRVAVVEDILDEPSSLPDTPRTKTCESGELSLATSKRSNFNTLDDKFKRGDIIYYKGKFDGATEAGVKILHLESNTQPRDTTFFIGTTGVFTRAFGTDESTLTGDYRITIIGAGLKDCISFTLE